MPVQTKMLTKATIENAKAVKNARGEIVRTEYPDGGNGLALVVQPNSSKSWIIRFRVRAAGQKSGKGRKVKATLGTYPAIPLADAREALRAARDRAEAGLPLIVADEAQTAPAASLPVPYVGPDDVIDGDYTVVEPQPALAPPADASGTVKAVWEDYVAKHLASRKPGSQKRFRGLFEKHMLPEWGPLPLKSISKAYCLEVIDDAQDRGPEARNSTIVVLSSFFNWALGRDLIDKFPLTGVKKTDCDSRARVLDGSEIKTFWNGCTSLGPIFGPMFQLLLLTGARRGEVAGMRYSELDLATRIWIIPGSRTKNGKPLAVFLTDDMIVVLNSLTKVPGRDQVFSRYGHSAASGYSKAKADLDLLAPIPDFRLHDLRRTFVSGLAGLKVPVVTIEKTVNHLSGELAGVAGVYNQWAYIEEKTEAWKLWSEHVRQLTKSPE